MSESTLKQKIEQLVAQYQQDQKDQEARHMAFMTEAMRILETRNNQLEQLQDQNKQLQSQLSLAQKQLREQHQFIQQLQRVPAPSTATAHLFTTPLSTQNWMLSSPATPNLQRGCE